LNSLSVLAKKQAKIAQQTRIFQPPSRFFSCG